MVRLRVDAEGPRHRFVGRTFGIYGQRTATARRLLSSLLVLKSSSPVSVQLRVAPRGERLVWGQE